MAEPLLGDALKFLKEKFDVTPTGVQSLTVSESGTRTFKVNTEPTSFILKVIPRDQQLNYAQILQIVGQNLPCPQAVEATKWSEKSKGPWYSYNGTSWVLFSWLPGLNFKDFALSSQPSEEAFQKLGYFVGTLDRNLLAYNSTKSHLEFEFDPSKLQKHMSLLKQIKDAEVRNIARNFLFCCDAISPQLNKLKKSVVHGNLNEYNLLFAGDSPSGIVGFSNCAYSITLYDLATVIAHCLVYVSDPLKSACGIIAGYHDAFPLQEYELEVLYPLICTRLSIYTIYNAFYRATSREHELASVESTKLENLLKYFYTEVSPGLALSEFKNTLLSMKPTLSVAEMREWRSSHLCKSLSTSYNKPIHVVRGRGAYLYDSDNLQYLDGVCHVGHCHPKVVSAAQIQMARLCTNTRYLGEEIINYINSLLKTFPPELSVCFLVCSGTEANELALRLARNYTKRRDIICLDGAYHGNSASAVEVSPYKFKGKGGFPCPPHIHVVDMPDTFRGKFRNPDRTHEGAVECGTKYAEQVKETMERHKDTIAAFMHESVMGCGGQIVLPPGYLSQAFKYAQEGGAICISDEVQIGFGRCGHSFWAFNHQDTDVVPDIVTMGKPIGNGHPMGAVVTRKEIADAFANGMEYFNTFGGNNVSCVIGEKVLEVIKEERLQENSLRIGQHIVENLKKIQTEHTIIGDVRGVGLFIGIEFIKTGEADLIPAPEAAGFVAQHMRENARVLVSVDGPQNNVIKLKPPLVWSLQDAEQFLRGFKAALVDFEP